MNLRLLRSRFALGSLLMLLSAGAVFAQNDHARAAAGGILGIFWLIMLAVYIYMALAIQAIANKTNTENSWLAWVPIANLILLLNIAGKPIWWIILCLIPIVNIIIFIVIWMGVAEARKKPGWLGVLMIVPLANFIVPGYLAWAE
jgi:Family of unknown function (DUF5684)